MIYKSYDFKIIEPTLAACPETLLSGLVGASGGFGTRRISVRQSWRSASGRNNRPSQGSRTASTNHACGLLNCWQWDSKRRWENCLRICDLSRAFIRRQIFKCQRAGSTRMTQVSRNKSERLRRLNQKVISSRYAARCFALILCHVPIMPRLSSENADSTVFVWMSPFT